MTAEVIRACASGLTLTVVTIWVAFVWGSISLKKEAIIDIPLPILIILLLGWGFKITPEMLSLFGV